MAHLFIVSCFIIKNWYGNKKDFIIFKYKIFKDTFLNTSGVSLLYDKFKAFVKHFSIIFKYEAFISLLSLLELIFSMLLINKADANLYYIL